MAVIAIIAAVYVGWMFAKRRYAVVTGAATAENLGVIDRKHGREHIGVVAIFADIGCLRMRRVLADRFYAVVAANTITADVKMIEIRR